MKVYLGPSSASTAIWWCHTVRTQVGLLEPLPCQTSPKHLLWFRGCGWLHPSSPGSRGRHVGSASRHPDCPHRRPDGCPCLGTRAQPLGSCWKGLGSLTGIPWDTQIATPSRTGKPEIKKPLWNLQHCIQFVLFPAWGWGWQSRSWGARFPMPQLTPQKATCSPLSEFNNLRSWQYLAAASSALTGKNANCFAEICFAKF